MVYAESSGSFEKTISFLQFLQSNRMFSILDHYGQVGVNELRKATPIDSGETAHSWTYEVVHQNGSHAIEWYNTHRHNYVNIAIILQYGHGTGTGGYVEGVDYINPALRPVFEKILNDIWRQVRDA